jgi:DeoR/GlpR family transcriptional regulator of sugar metabolism
MGQGSLLGEQRRRLILEKLKRQGVVKTSELSELLSVSPMTIRNDLNALAKEGKLIRIHGGAAVKDWVTSEPSYQEKASLNIAEKRRIAQRAAELLKEGMAVFIGNGSTTMQLVQALPAGLHLRVFTNALNHALELTRVPGVDVYVIGGYLRGVSYAMVGPLAKRSLGDVYFDIAFLGANGISPEHGVTIPSLEEADTAAEILRHARRRVILADHTKFGVVTHGKIADLSQVDAVITDSGLKPELRRLFSEVDVEIILA